MELKYKNINDFKSNTKLIKRIMFKPNAAPIACIIVGASLLAIAFLTSANTFIVASVGIFFILMALSVLLFVKDHPVLDIYDDGVLVYNPNNCEQVVFLDYDMIDMWKPERDSGNDRILFIFPDGSKLPVTTFHISQAFKVLDKLQHEKLERVVKERNSKPLIATNPIENIKNIFSKKKNDDKEKAED